MDLELSRPAHVKEGSQGTAVLDVEQQETVEEAPEASNEYGHVVVASRSPESSLDESPATSLQNTHSNSSQEQQLRHGPQPPSMHQEYSNPSTTWVLLGVEQRSLKETHPPSASSAVHQVHIPSPAPHAAMFQDARDTHISGYPNFINISVGHTSSARSSPSQEDERHRDPERQRQFKLYRWSKQHQFLLLVLVFVLVLLLPLYGYLLRAETTTPVQVVSASSPPPQPPPLRPMLPRHRPKQPFLPPPPPLLRPTPPPSPSPCSSPS